MNENKDAPLGNDFLGLDIRSLLGAPLEAVAHANSMMAIEQMQFILDYCFHKDENGYKPVMVNMTLTRSYIDNEQPVNDDKNSVNISQVATTFSLPILTIIPISSLGVESLEVDFEMEIKSQYKRSNEKNGSSNSSQTVKDNPNEPNGSINADTIIPKNKSNTTSAILRGVISSDTKSNSSNNSKSEYDKTNSARLVVNIKAGNLPLPLGITTILDAFTKSIQPIEITNKK